MLRFTHSRHLFTAANVLFRGKFLIFSAASSILTLILEYPRCSFRYLFQHTRLVQDCAQTLQ